MGSVRVGGLAVESTLTPDVFSDFGRWCREQKGRGFAARTARLVMAMFNHADQEDWISRPVKFGKRFRQMSKVPRPKQKSPPTAVQIRAVLRHLRVKVITLRRTTGRGRQSPDATVQLVAQIYLAVNGGYGARDLADLPKDAAIVDLDGGVIDYRRGKTDQVRRVPLMPETRRWVRRVWRQRPGDKLLFRTREGQPVCREVPVEDSDGNITVSTHDAVNQAYSKVMVELGFKIAGNGFYKIKDLHCTTADEYGDDRAARLLTGHAGVQRSGYKDIRDVYVTVKLDRQRKLVEFIRHTILLPSAASPASTVTAETPEVG